MEIVALIAGINALTGMDGTALNIIGATVVGDQKGQTVELTPGSRKEFLYRIQMFHFYLIK